MKCISFATVAMLGERSPGANGKLLSSDVPIITQKRACTSPIWYTP